MPPPANASAIILLSGGLDSATLLAWARARGMACLALSFDYGQRHRHELDAARRVAAALGAVEHRVVRLDPRAFAGSALTGPALSGGSGEGGRSPDVPKGRDESQMSAAIPVTYVPARNLVFLSIAIATAESVGASDILIGVNAVDYSGYPDCRPAFIQAMQEAARLGTRAGVEGRGVRVLSPLVEMSKSEIIRLGASLGVDYSLTVSCYDPLDGLRGIDGPGWAGCEIAPIACGSCDACILRRQGFEAAGVPDPTVYASKNGEPDLPPVIE
ncbi:MAG: 7-cyano-7-deazaguanine synthase QueC [Phycisphaerales bacterium]